MHQCCTLSHQRCSNVATVVDAHPFSPFCLSLSLSSLPFSPLNAAPADAPSITSIASPDPSSIFLTWTPPTVSNGVIRSYKIQYTPVNHPGEANQTVLGGERRMWELGGLRPFTNYSVELSASTSAGESPPDVTFIRTNESGRLRQ